MVAAQQVVTVIVPTYNRREMLERAISSVESQTYSETRLIVVDQGSTDGTPDLLTDWKIRWHLEERLGAGYARNRGLGESESEFVMFLDSDDWLVPEAIESLMEVIQRHSADCAYGSITNFLLEGTSRLLKQPTTVAPLASSSLFRRAAFDRFGMFDNDNHSFPRWVIQSRKKGLRECRTNNQIAFRGIHSRNVSIQPGSHRYLFDLVRGHRTLSEGG